MEHRRVALSRARPRAAVPATAVTPGPGYVLALQRALGNRAVARALRPRVLARDVSQWSDSGKIDPAQIERMYQEAVSAGDWARVIGMVNSAAHDRDILALLRPIQQRGPEALKAAIAVADQLHWDEDHPVRRELAFLLMEGQLGQKARAPRHPGFSLGTPSGSSDPVAGGTVTAYDAVTDPRGGREDFFALQYQGPHAEETGWLQFVAVEAEAFDAGSGGNGEFQDGSMTGRYQDEKMRYGTASSPDWHLDTISDVLPFYEAANAAGGRGSAIVRYDTPGTPARPGHPATPVVGGETTMIDRPQADPQIVKHAFGKGVRRVERRARFHEYLVRGEDVLYENELVVQDTYWRPEETPVRHNIMGRRSATNRLQAPHYHALIGRRPEFSFYQHDS